MFVFSQNIFTFFKFTYLYSTIRNLNYKMMSTLKIKNIVLTWIISLVCTFSLYAQGTVHVIVYSDTKGTGGIATSAQQAVNYFKYELIPGIQKYSGMKVESYFYTGEQFKRGNIRSELQNISTNSYDVIMFFFEGHGSNSGDTDWTRLSFTGFVGGASIEYLDVYHLLKAKNHRLLLMFANASNTEIINNNIGEKSSTSRYVMQGGRAQRYKELFQNHKGYVLIASAAKGQEARAIIGTLSYYYTAFRKTFGEALNSDNPARWHNICSKIQSYMTSIAENKEGHYQTPIYSHKLQINSPYIEPTKDETDFLKNMKGKYPHEVKFWDNVIVKKRLKKLLGSRFTFLMDNHGPESPIEIKNNLFMVWTCQAHNCGATNFIIVIDLSKNVLYTGIREDYQIEVYSEDGSSLPRRASQEWK